MADLGGCTHPVQMAGMCAVCGKELDSNAMSQTSFSLMHSHAGVKVSEDEARRLDSETTAHLLSQRKLALVVDLDQTIIHATVDPTVGDWMRDDENPNYDALRDVGIFKLGVDGKAASGVAIGGDAVRQCINDATVVSDDGNAAGCWYYVKPRPGLDAFLKSLSQRYELHVYTMGTRSYADCVCKLVDPDGSIFANRILSRDENGSLVQKSLSRLFPVDTSMVVIIDDRADVWKWSPNLVKVVPYDFFVGIGDINATFLPAAPVLPGDPSSGASNLALPGASTSATSSASESPSGGSMAAAVAAASSSTSPDETPKPTGAVDASETGEDSQAKPTKEAVALLAAQSQKLEEILSEQRQERPLAKRQEALNEKLSATPQPNGDSAHDAEEVAAAPNGKGKERGEADGASAGTGEARQPTPASGSGREAGKAATPANTEAAPASGSVATTTPPSPPQQQGDGQAHLPQAVLRDDDTELQRIQEILDDIHLKWYTRYDDTRPKSGEDSDGGSSERQKADDEDKPTVTDLIAARKTEVLRDCFVSFSGMIPSNVAPKSADIWRVAEEYGATCISNLTPSVTHVVAARPGTVKAMRALTRPRISVVWPGWLHDSIARWERRPETWYLLPALEGNAKAAHAEDAWDDPLDGEPGSIASKPLSADAEGEEREGGRLLDHDGGDGDGGEGGGQAISGFAEMDWAEAADEVDQFLDDDSEADNESETDSETDAITEVSSPSTPTKRKDKRERNDVVSDLLLRSPLSKRRKRTEDRMGKSKLKQSVTGDDLINQHPSPDSDGDDDVDAEAAKTARPRPKPSAVAAAANGGFRSRLATPGGGDEAGTDTGSIDESFLDDLANEIDLQMDEDADGASHSDDD